MVFSRLALVAPMTALCLAGSPAPAQTLSERVATIEARLAEGDGDAAMAEARALLFDVNEQAPFGVRNARLTVEPATGYGVYEPVIEAVFAPGSPVHGYVELHGFSLVRNAVGVNQIAFDVAFAMLDPDGNFLTDVTSMGAVEIVSRNRPADAFIHLTYRIRGAEGPYVIWTEVTDRASGESATFELPVTFDETAPERGAQGN